MVYALADLQKFAGKPKLIEANQRALKAGRAYCDATEVFTEVYEVPPATLDMSVRRRECYPNPIAPTTGLGTPPPQPRFCPLLICARRNWVGREPSAPLLRIRTEH